jgi:predicted flavoprotein YhiN
LLLPKDFIPLFSEQLKVAEDKEGNQISSKERKEIAALLKDFRFKIIGKSDFLFQKL